MIQTSPLPHPAPHPEAASVVSPWPAWRRLLFRFTVMYVGLYMSPLKWAGGVPLLNLGGNYYSMGESWLVTLANRHLFHVKEELVPFNGSGDTSYGYAQLCLFTLLALIGTAVWSALDRRRAYDRLSYWFLVALRYYVALVALLYGTIKLFGQQMIFPSLSQLATPLGDLLPMRFSWLFIGYSEPYQFFSGAVEVLAGVLLLWRRTATLGAFVATSVFLNVMMMNLCYDIPVKLFSIHLFVFSNLLLLSDARRLLDFFVFNRPTQPKRTYAFTSRRARIGWLVLKAGFVLFFGLLPLYRAYQYSQPEPVAGKKPPKPKLKAGFYEVADFRVPPAFPDSLRWQNVVFEEEAAGSIQTPDTLFRQRYRRGYFSYDLDSARHTIAFRKFADDSLALFTLHIDRPDTNRLLLRGLFRGDSLTVALRRTNRHFQLAERQFHWLSEANR
ncbi:hypothetical protein [Spirosoma sordidisoli]|uniref:hypothetical protein n=1 Tax=Spirosoma sordidisoli TaxID=2502893 RepID=UPI001F0F45FE|nr:hypothetical protein [Spirosoma sordidisoli]